jgi:hypothetical protein
MRTHSNSEALMAKVHERAQMEIFETAVVFVLTHLMAIATYTLGMVSIAHAV